MKILTKKSNIISRIFFTKYVLPLLFLSVSRILIAQEVTGLSDWTIYIDQGHSQTENMGLYNYSEAEKNLRVGLALREMFLQQTDIDTVYLARETDSDVISLEGRTDEANTLGVDFYYSIHSDAGPPSANRTLMLYGGWKSNGELVEKTPEGGGAMGDLLDLDLTSAMRINRSGNFADRVFYQGDVFHHTNQWPYLHVNRTTTMASFLSEGGFHTNPEQQMRNMNAEWKVLEALAAFRSFLEWHELVRPEMGIVSGYITDIETGLKINGATVTIGDETYTTDSYESLFNQYSNNPDLLRNGFYYIDSLVPGSTVLVQFTRENYQPQEVEITLNSDPAASTGDILNFLDVEMLSLEPPVVEFVQPADEFEALIPGTPILVEFSRKMDLLSLVEGTTIEPATEFTIEMADEFTAQINTEAFAYLENYTITFDGSVVTNSLTGQFLDGDNDGTEGGNYSFSFTMSDEDTDAPFLLDYSPVNNSTPVGLRPILRFVYDEIIMEESITESAITLHPRGLDFPVEGSIHHSIINEASVLHFFPTIDLDPATVYEATVAAGLSDMFNNETEAFHFEFSIVNKPVNESGVIDDFNDGINDWWTPGQAGQTVGYIPELTSRMANIEFVNHSVTSTGSMQLNYGWDPDFAGTPYIRQYLPPTAPQNNNRFNIDDVLQVYVFGDGSGNEFRMVIRDGANQLETTNWVAIDWVGWKLVSWDLSNDPTVGWFSGGDGSLDGANFYFDGFHLRKAEGSLDQGSIYFDHLHFVKQETVEYPTTLSENWQGYEDFTTNIFPWITLDLDGEVTWNPAGFTFPGAGEPYAFKVLNPGLTEPPITENHPPVDGDKYLIAMMSQKVGENKWLISPQFRATEVSELSFFAKSIEIAEFGPERMKVYIIEDDSTAFSFDPEAFTLISEGDFIEVPDEWTPYSYFLGDHAGKVLRFAVQYVSEDDYMLMLDKFEVGLAPTYTLSLVAEPEEGGTLTGEGEFMEGFQSALSAEPSMGYSFTEWQDAESNTLSTDNPYTFTMPGEATTVKGVFALADYLLTIAVEPEEGGSVTGDGTYNFNESVTVEAIPNEGYSFVNWTGRDNEVLSTETVYTFEMPATNRNITAVFEESVNINEVNESVSIYPNPASSLLTIQSDLLPEQIIMRDLAGRTILTLIPDGKQQDIDVSNMEAGIYIIEMVHSSGSLYRKIEIMK